MNVKIICGGEPATAVAVYLAALTASGRPKLERKRPVYHRCDRCGDIVKVVYEFRGGDPAEVLPPDPPAGSQAELNGPGGSPTSPPRRAPEGLERQPEWDAQQEVDLRAWLAPEGSRA